MKNTSKLLAFLKQKKVYEFVAIVERDKTINVDHFYKNPDNGTLLDIACRSSGNSEFVRILLQHKANPNRINHETNNCAIYEAVQYTDKETLTLLIEHENHEAINFKNIDGNVPLHIVIKHNNIEFLKILLQNRHPPIDINATNMEKSTPLHLALQEGHLEAASLLLQFPDIDLDFRKDCEGYTCRQIIQQKHPHLMDQLQEEFSSNPKRILWSLLYRGETKEFIKVAEAFDEKYLGVHFNDKTYLLFACVAGFIDVVDMLLKKGVDPNKYLSRTFYRYVTPINAAALEGKYEIFERLLKEPRVLSNTNIETVLSSIISGMMDKKEKENHYFYKCFEFMFNEIIPRGIMTFGNIFEPFEAASFLEDDRITKALMYAVANWWKTTGFGIIPWHSIKATILEDSLDDCISSSQVFDGFSEKNAIKFNYKLFLIPRLDISARRNEIEPISQIEKVPHLRKLLKHPVPESYIHMKWRLIQKYYYINLITYVLFYVSLNFYIISNYNDDDTSFTSIFAYGNEIITLIFYWMIILREFCQFTFSPKSYVRSLENWLEIVMIILTGVFILTETHSNWRSAIGAYAILISSMEMVLILGKHPMCATYIEIFKAVAWNFFIFFSLYSALIISFAFSFYILFQDTSQNETRSNATANSINSWRSPEISILKTITMLTGELGVETLPLSSTLNNSHFVFISFLFFITIVLQNLLNGLAVSNTRTIAEDADFVVLVSRLKLIYQLECLSFSDPFKWLCYLSPSRFVYMTKLLQNIKTHLWSFFNRVYGNKIELFDNRCPPEISVIPDSNNSVYLSSNSSTWQYKYYPAEVLPEGMPSSIVEKASQILETRKIFHRVDDNEYSLKIHAMKEQRQKFQSVDKLGQTFIAQMRELESKIDENIANREENLIKHISTLETNIEQIKKLLNR